MAMPIRNQAHGRAVLTLRIKIKPNPGTTPKPYTGPPINPEPARKPLLSHSYEKRKRKEEGRRCREMKTRTGRRNYNIENTKEEEIGREEGHACGGHEIHETAIRSVQRQH